MRKCKSRLGSWTTRLMTVAGLGALSFITFHALRGESAAVSDKKDDGTGVSVPAGQEWRVSRGPLSISLLAPGEIRAKVSTSIICQIQGEGKIIWIVPEGHIVKRGDKLVELEVNGLQENLLRQKVSVANSEAAYSQSKGELEIQLSKNRSDLIIAQNKLELAEIQLSKYLEGDFPQKLRTIESDIKVAEAELQRARDRFEGTQKLLDKGYVNRGELEADQLSLTKAEIELDKARNQKALLEDYEKKAELNKLETSRTEAKEELARTKTSAESELKNRQANLESSRARLELEQLQLKNLEDQLAASKIYAPQSGMVVYATDNNRWGNNTNRIEEGALVRNRQKIIELPDFSAWTVETRVHESMIQQVEEGQKGLISIDALAGQVIAGEVEKIGVLPDSSRWFMPDTKEYIVNLDLSTTTLPLKPGMSAKTELMLKELSDVLYVPMQAVSTVGGKTQVWVKGEAGAGKRDVEVGLNNDRFVEIKSGLSEGDVVLLASPLTNADTTVINRPSDQLGNGEARLDESGKSRREKDGGGSAAADSKDDSTQAKAEEKPAGAKSDAQQSAANDGAQPKADSESKKEAAVDGARQSDEQKLKEAGQSEPDATPSVTPKQAADAPSTKSIKVANVE